VSLSTSEFEEWWGHPVTRAYMATLRESVVMAQEESLSIAHHRTLEEVALSAVAYTNRANTLLDIMDKSLIAAMMEVENESEL